MKMLRRLVTLAAFGVMVTGAGFALSGCDRVSVAAAQPCVNNLFQIEGAKARWAIEHHKDTDTNAVPSMQEIQPYLGHALNCPDGGTYTVGRIGEQPKCSLAGKLTAGRMHALPKE